MTFNVDRKHPDVMMKLGISFVSEANAKANLRAENPETDAQGNRNWRFRHRAPRGGTAWNARLNAIQVHGGSDADKTKFYTALYHASLRERVQRRERPVPGFLRVERRSGRAPTRQVEKGRTMYANFSGWDIDRSFIQLQALLDPVRTSDIVQSLVLDAKACGAFPRWAYFNTETAVMPGDAGSIIVANAHAFGATNFDTQAALSIMKNSTAPGAACAATPVMGSRADYDRLGYVPSSESGDNQTASNTLEYAVRDFAVSRFAAALGDTTTAGALLKSSGNWHNLFDQGAIQPKTSAGAWVTDGTGFMEGNSEQYTWYVPHDLAGVVAQAGGVAPVVKRLDTFFTHLNIGTVQPYFYVGNEVTMAVPWVYAWAGAPSHTQRVLHASLANEFGTGAAGLPGNDDLGAISGWYVWAALGLYPVVPGVSGVALSGPAVREDHGARRAEGRQLPSAAHRRAGRRLGRQRVVLCEVAEAERRTVLGRVAAVRADREGRKAGVRDDVRRERHDVGHRRIRDAVVPAGGQRAVAARRSTSGSCRQDRRRGRDERMKLRHVVGIGCLAVLSGCGGDQGFDGCERARAASNVQGNQNDQGDQNDQGENGGATQRSVLHIVDPMIGTANLDINADWSSGVRGHGHVYPGATVPFGMVQLGPDTTGGAHTLPWNWDRTSGYQYDDPLITGFTHTHLSGTGIGSGGEVRFLPTLAPVDTATLAKVAADSSITYNASFSHDDETAAPATTA